MSDELNFHFTIGPVQGFVAQARRTRDFWAGSFLLSWLSGVAMLAVSKQGGVIEFPVPTAGYLDWLQGKGEGETPRQGAIPNRFKARVPSAFDGKEFNGREIEQTVRDAWCELAEHIWRADLSHVEGNAQARAIWERQHKNFWEISWILTDSEAADLLDRRKNWRSHLHGPEPGAKCMVMEGWQELSGAPAPGHALQDTFWNAVRAQRNNFQTDLREGERLCALAFVKRRFARHFAGFEAEVGGLALRGWELPHSVPSVSYMAAVHWLEASLHHPDQQAMQRMLEAAQSLDPARDEWETRIRCLEEARKKYSVPRPLIARDGGVFFEHTRHNAKLYPQQDKAKELDSALQALKLDAPLSPFYAILLMDGDSLGVHMGDPRKQPKIAASLNRFTQRVPAVVQQHNGFLVFAGGDDVFAILPLEDALPCAKALRDEYAKCFSETGIPSTLSGAVQFAHVKMPLGRVLEDAHDLLDHVAKDGRGRDALAVRVWKPGGCALQWAQPWTIALDGQEGTLAIERIAADFASQDTMTSFSSKFFYKIRERFDLLNPTKDHPESVMGEEEEALLLASDYLTSGVNEGRSEKITLVQATALLQPLLTQCRPYVRVIAEEEKVGEEKATFAAKQPRRLDADGALLVRFLAHKGVEPRVGRG